MRWDWKATLGIVISVLLLWWVLRGVDAGEVWAVVSRANWWLLLASTAVTTSGFFIRALRWKAFLHPLQPGTGLHNRFAAVNIGFMTNNLLPARVGEFARAYAVSRTERVSMSGAIGSLVVERFLDAVVIFLLMLLAVAWPTFPAAATVAGRPLADVLLVTLGFVSALLVGVVVLLLFPRIFLKVVRGITGLFSPRIARKLVGVIHAFVRGLGSLRNLRLVALGMAWTFALWLWNGFSFWLGFRAFGIDLDYFAALFVQSLVALGVAIPSGPGFFGTFHAAARVGLAEVYGVGHGATLAFAFGYHLAAFIPVTVIGLGYAWRLGMSLKEVGESEERAEAALETPATGGPMTEGPTDPGTGRGG